MGAKCFNPGEQSLWFNPRPPLPTQPSLFGFSVHQKTWIAFPFVSLGLQLCPRMPRAPLFGQPPCSQGWSRILLRGWERHALEPQKLGLKPPAFDALSPYAELPPGTAWVPGGPQHLCHGAGELVGSWHALAQADPTQPFGRRQFPRPRPSRGWREGGRKVSARPVPGGTG